MSKIKLINTIFTKFAAYYKIAKELALLLHLHCYPITI